MVGSRTRNLSNGNLLTTHAQEELSHALIIAGIIISNLNLDSLLACSTIDNEGVSFLTLHQFTPDFV